MIRRIRRALGVGLGLIVSCLLLSGCSAAESGSEKLRDLDFTVVSEENLPPELKKLIDDKGSEAFKLTYTDSSNLYIAVGYGPQPTGGCSILVHELYLTENSIVLKTELKGPEAGENPGTEPSSPKIVLCTELSELPVIFQ